MFQTEINHYLQSYDSPIVIFLMNLISQAGYPAFYLGILIVLMFGIDFKKAFITFQVLIWTVIATMFLKKYVYLPRPLDVDYSLKTFETNYNEANTLFKNMGARGFFDNLPEQVVEHYRKVKLESNGFPSGHVSGTTSFWASLTLLFGQKWLSILAFTFIVLMPVSRMFLGQHFLADVLGGLVVAGFFLLFAFVFILKNEKLTEYLLLKSYQFKANQNTILPLLYFLILPLLLFFMPLVEPALATQLLAFNLAYLLVAFKGFPQNTGAFLQRFLRVLVAVLLFVGTSLLFKFIFESLQIPESWSNLRRGLETFVFVWGGCELNFKLSLWKREA